MNFDNQKIYHLINLYFFVASVVLPKPVLTRYLGTLLGFQNYELLDFILQCDLFSSIVQLNVKHQLLHNCSFDDQTSMKILDPQRHSKYQGQPYPLQKTTIAFLDPPKKMHVTFVEYSWSIQGIFLYSIFLEHYFGIPEIIQGTFSKYPGNISWECCTNIPQTYLCPVINLPSEGQLLINWLLVKMTKRDLSDLKLNLASERHETHKCQFSLLINNRSINDQQQKPVS